MDFCIERYHGNSLVLPVALTTPLVSESGAITYVPLSIAGAAIRFKLGEITELSDGYSITRDDPAGNFTIIISATLMATLVNTVYYFAAEITYASGIRETLFVGKLTLKDNVVA
jgi:hypothetical protein